MANKPHAAEKDFSKAVWVGKLQRGSKEKDMLLFPFLQLRNSDEFACFKFMMHQDESIYLSSPKPVFYRQGQVFRDKNARAEFSCDFRRACRKEQMSSQFIQ